MRPLEELPVIGTPAQVAEVIRHERETGRLAAMSLPREVGAGQMMVRLHLVRPPRRVRPAVVVGIGLSLAAAAGLVWLVIQVAAALIAVAPLLLLIAVVTVVCLLGRLGSCPGLHCPGCKH